MPSLSSRLFAVLLRHRHLFRLQLKSTPWSMETSITDFRAQCEKFHIIFDKFLGSTIDGIDILPTAVEDLPAEWIVPRNADDNAVLLYAIGGGYVSGSCQDHRRLVARIALGCGVRTLLVEHRLAPEHPFPAALNDMLTAYSWLLTQGIAPKKILIAGESAGGGLCLATLLALRDQGMPLPAAGVAVSPWTDLNQTGESHRTKAKKCLSPANMAHVCSKHYAGACDPCNPLISPLYGNLQGLPPLLIQAGGDETLLDDSTRFAIKAKDAGVDITLHVSDGMWHCFSLMTPFIPECQQGIKQLCSYIKTHLLI